MYWSAAKARGLAFVINQTGDGAYYHDSNFVANWQAEMSLEETDNSFKVKLLDYTALFIDAKRMPVASVPCWEDSLDAAFRNDMNDVKSRLLALEVEVHTLAAQGDR